MVSGPGRVTGRGVDGSYTRIVGSNIIFRHHDMAAWVLSSILDGGRGGAGLLRRQRRRTAGRLSSGQRHDTQYCREKWRRWMGRRAAERNVGVEGASEGCECAVDLGMGRVEEEEGERESGRVWSQTESER